MNLIFKQLLYTITLFFIIKSDDIRATARFDTLIKIVIVESAPPVTDKVATNNIAIKNTIASNAIADIVTILLKTRLI